ncbi:MAG TPA: TRAP transporter substrate-binding protein [Stellaceae bacterium]|jgi:TRAP-type C4-dicarboxylate transport system substrate-binding protein|nr:TRAP transporter substrate-binding protein [Stellaceae bacterium]
MLRYALSIVCAFAALLASRAAPADELKLIMTTIAQPTSPVGQQTYHDWADRVNAQGKGVVQIDVRDGFALASSTNFYDRLLSDVMQISFGSLNYLAGKFKLSEVMALPFVMKSAEQESVVFWRLYKTGMLDSEFDQIVPLFMQAFPPVSMHLVKPPTRPLDDINGLKFIASGKIPTEVVQRLGGSPLSIGLTESYSALQRGTADGIDFPMAAMRDFKLDEVTHYHIDAAFGGGPGGVWMVKAKFDALPDNVKKILMDNSGEAWSRRAGQILDNLGNEERDRLSHQPDQTVVSLSAEQNTKWGATLSAVANEWAATDDAHRQVLAKVRDLAAQVPAGH